MKSYILQGHKAVHVDRETYLKTEEQDCTVAKSNIGDYLISTVFLGLDHQWHAHGPPLLFETMVFGKAAKFSSEIGARTDLLNERQERCTTWEQAEEMHEKMCEEVRREINKEQA